MGQLREYRKAAKITLSDLAARIGVTEGQLSRIERGQSGVSLTTASAIERETGIPASTFAPAQPGNEDSVSEAGVAA
jgi:transcriptional regulator with XRE-family HTH domain